MGNDTLEIVGDEDRMDAVRASGLLDSARDDVYDRLTRRASELLDASGALLTVVDEDRQFFKSSHGLSDPWASRRETPLEYSLCKFVVARGEPYVVEDARTRSELSENRALSELGIVAYLGVPLRYGGDRVIGSLSVFGSRPRRWSDRDRERMEVAASFVEVLLGGGNGGRAAPPASGGGPEEGEPEEAAPLWTGYRPLVEGLPVGVMVHREGTVLYANPEARRVLGIDPGKNPSLLDFVQPEERERVERQVARVQEEREAVGMQRYRAVTADGGSRTVEAKAVPVVFRGEPAVQVVFRDLSGEEKAEEKFSRLFRLSPVPTSLSTLEGSRFVEVNGAFERFSGYEREELVGQRALDLGLWADRGHREEMVEQIERRGRAEGVEARVRRKSGEVREVRLYGERIEIGGEGFLLAVTHDITEALERERKIRRSEQRYRRIFEDSRDVILITDRHGRIRDVNPAGEALFGYDRDALVGADVGRLYRRDEDRERFQREVEQGGYVEDFEVQVVTSEGEVRDCLLTATARTDDRGEVVGYQGLVRDVTERKRFERELEHRALHDPLTDLPNRTLFWDRLEQAVARLRREEGQLAVLFLDLDQFKAVNDSLGHAAGDRVLQQVAERLEAAVREHDTVARMGGDEFTVLLEGLDEAVGAREVASRITEAVEAPLEAGGEEVHLHVSVGVAHLRSREGRLSPEIDRPEELVQQADAAVLRAKDEATARVVAYDPERDAAGTARIQRENELRRAVEREEFVFHYQPVVDLESGAVVGVEPLIRWRHPERGLLRPGEFLQLAEDSGLILPMGRWGLRQAARTVSAWKDLLGPDRRLDLHFNLSASQFEDPELDGLIREVTGRDGIDPGALVLEVTEHIVMRTPDRTRELAGEGVRIAIDDFGTGYSSLSHVRELAVHALKIDRSFLEGLEETRPDTAIVTTILTLGETLGLEVVAEGVEREGQLRWLEDAGCRLAQGYLLARPRPADDLLPLLDGDPELRPEAEGPELRPEADGTEGP